MFKEGPRYGDNPAKAGGCSYSKSKSAEATTEEFKGTGVKKAEAEVEA